MCQIFQHFIIYIKVYLSPFPSLFPLLPLWHFSLLSPWCFPLHCPCVSRPCFFSAALPCKVLPSSPLPFPSKNSFCKGLVVSLKAPAVPPRLKNLQKNSLKYLVVSGEVRNFAPANEAAASLSPPQTVITRLKTGKFDNDSKKNLLKS